MADTPIYFRFFIDDYLRDAEELSLTRHGVYVRLMLWYYARAKPIPNDLVRIYQRVNARNGEEEGAVKFVLGEFFQLRDGFWFHKRIEAELADWRSRSRAAKSSVTAREEKRHKNKGATSSNDERTIIERSSNQNQNQNQNQNKEEPKTKTRAERASARLSGSVHSKAKPAVTSDDPSFDSFWLAYPKKRSKADARKAWTKLKPGAQLVQRILTSIRNAKASPEWLRDNGRYIQHPATWLNGEGWEDVVAGEPSRHDEL